VLSFHRVEAAEELVDDALEQVARENLTSLQPKTLTP